MEPILCNDCGEDADKAIGGAYDGDKWVCIQCLLKNRQQLTRTKLELEAANYEVERLTLQIGQYWI